MLNICRKYLLKVCLVVLMVSACVLLQGCTKEDGNKGTEEKEYETQLGIENKQIEARLEAVKADLEALETCREENIKDDFGYFQQ